MAVFLGQSNAKGWSTDPINTTVLSTGYGYEYYPNGSSGVFLPLGQSLLGRTQGGPQRAFAQAWAAGGGGAVLCVDAAVNGCSMDKAAKSTATGSGVNLGGGTWDLSDAATRYTSWAKPLIDAALVDAASNGFDVQKLVFVWAQGESDAAANGLTSGAAYTTKLEALIDQIASDYDIDAFIVSELGTHGVTLASSNSYWNDIRTAQSTVIAARSTIAVMGSTAAKGLYDLGQMVDTLHYTQAGYNTIGADCAAAGLTFLGGLSLGVPPTTKWFALAAAFPAIAGWKRVQLDTVRNGSWACQVFSDPTTPFACSFVDGSGSNPTSGDATIAWSFSGSATKSICLYISDTVGASLAVVPGATAALSRVKPLDAAKVNTLNMSTAGALDTTFSCDIADLVLLDTSLRLWGSSAASNFTTALTLTNVFLTRFSGLTTLVINRSATGLLDLTLTPDLVSYAQSQVGLSVSDVNAILQALDANGKSGGTVSIAQFWSGHFAASAPTGAGAAAKTSLQGKGWTVVTD